MYNEFCESGFLCCMYLFKIQIDTICITQLHRLDNTVNERFLCLTVREKDIVAVKTGNGEKYFALMCMCAIYHGRRLPFVNVFI